MIPPACLARFLAVIFLEFASTSHKIKAGEQAARKRQAVADGTGQQQQQTEEAEETSLLTSGGPRSNDISKGGKAEGARDDDVRVGTEREDAASITQEDSAREGMLAAIANSSVLSASTTSLVILNM